MPEVSADADDAIADDNMAGDDVTDDDVTDDNVTDDDITDDDMIDGSYDDVTDGPYDDMTDGPYDDVTDGPYDDDMADQDQVRPMAGDGLTSVLVRLRVPDQTDEFDAGRWDLRVSQQVLVEADRGGQAVGTVIRVAQKRRRKQPLKRVVRPINAEDLRIIERNRVREREAHLFCVERIKARELPMKLVSVDLAHSGTRAVFYFSSADRVDFRSLVKDLARRFHTRIEMRQIGVRDAARHTGGIGICGRELCCATWLCAFKPISIRMAKDQNLALNHQKLSGLCGRLRCCLQYEQETYQAQRKGLPKIGKRIVTPEGEGRIKDVNVLRRLVRVQLLDGGYVQYDADEVQRPTAEVQPRQEQPRQEQEQEQEQPSQEPPRREHPRREQTRQEQTRQEQPRQEQPRQQSENQSRAPTSPGHGQGIDTSDTAASAASDQPLSGDGSHGSDASKANTSVRPRRRRRRGRRGRKPQAPGQGGDGNDSSGSSRGGPPSGTNS